MPSPDPEATELKDCLSYKVSASSLVGLKLSLRTNLAHAINALNMASA